MNEASKLQQWLHIWPPPHIVPMPCPCMSRRTLHSVADPSSTSHTIHLSPRHHPHHIRMPSLTLLLPYPVLMHSAGPLPLSYVPLRRDPSTVCIRVPASRGMFHCPALIIHFALCPSSSCGTAKTPCLPVSVHTSQCLSMPPSVCPCLPVSVHASQCPSTPPSVCPRHTQLSVPTTPHPWSVHASPCFPTTPHLCTHVSPWTTILESFK